MSFKFFFENEVKKQLPRRYKGIVGKPISEKGGITKVYIHKQYAKLIAPNDKIEYAYQKIKKIYPEFKYNTLIVWIHNQSKKIVKIQFTNSPDFDTSSEPTTGELISYSFDDDTVSKPKYWNTIWHHKWMWVMDDYSGFDVEASKRWSEEWFNKLSKIAVGYRDSFEKQLDDANVDKTLRA